MTSWDEGPALKARGSRVLSFKRPRLGHALDDDGVAEADEFLSRHVVHTVPAEQDHAHS
jgi:hypothetical protein